MLVSSVLQYILALPFFRIDSEKNPPLRNTNYASGVQTDPSLADGQTFDYIIIGAGLSGITVASRLSEDPSISILLLEAGNDARNDPDVYDIHKYGNAFNRDDLMWKWPADWGRLLQGGKTLGGGSSINGAAWTRGASAQYDAFGKLLTADEASLNWNWNSVFSYMKKSENATAPNSQQQALGAVSNPAFHGNAGPVHVSFPLNMYSGPQQPAFVSSITNLSGIEHCPDLNGGDADCVSYTPLAIEPDDNRSSSATAYLSPVEATRDMWLTLVGQRATKILLSGTAPNVIATGVQFKSTSNTGSVFTAYAQKEVIISTGAISTPQLLQLSGIGDPSALGPLGINTIVNIPTVGRNLQEQPMSTLAHSAKDGFDDGGDGPSNCIAYPSLEELFTPSGGSNGTSTAAQIGSYITDNYPSWAKKEAVNGLSADALNTIFGIQASLIVNESVPVAELFYDQGYPDTIGTIMWLLLPFSRGNVTITSTDIFTLPKVTVNWFDIDVDFILQTAAARLVRNTLNSTAFSSFTKDETFPGLNNVANDDGHGGSDAAWAPWISNNFIAVSHPIGTAAMMRRDLGGVVDGRLKVYDTKNLRVVDASVLPLQVSAHLSSPLYGVAEKAAGIIKSGV